ncbi:intraflagellar transport protein 140 homolog isoform X2 [Pollicipes pollicipes]|uniref:intraflagellar transport protein 140 homolog isoform X2 n=1 Tax=Pollicipes pollicipes TaxID=41117 RepID=UPI0018850886|nr:intraflagellar transport protein 140 homolog isoform X2 [Pollicipes pollicipes]
MSVYFDRYIDDQQRGVLKVGLEWHRVAPLVAVSWYSEQQGGGVSLYNDEGDLVPGLSVPASSTQVTAIVWHPIKKVLLLGWETGVLQTWSEHDRALTDIQSLHKSPVTLAMWSAAGGRLITADTSGTLVGWKGDGQCNVTVVFQHDLKDPLTQLVYRSVEEHHQQQPSVDLGGLAKAAVSGDEVALDMFSSWRPKTSSTRFLVARQENLNLFVGSASGIIYYITESGNCMEVLQADGAIRFLLFYEGKEELVVVTETMVLGEFQVEYDGTLTEITKVKLSGRNQDMQLSWAGPGVLAVATGEPHIRLWDLDKGDNYAVRLDGHYFNEQDAVLSLAFCPGKAVLAAGTSMGKVAFYKYFKVEKDEEHNWHVQYVATVSGPAKMCRWGSTKNLLAVNTVKDVVILREHQMCTHFNDMVSAVQVSPTQLSIDIFTTKQHMELKSDIQIQGTFVAVDQVVIWSGRRVVVYEFSPDAQHARVVGSFESTCEMAALYETNLYLADQGNLVVTNFQGAVKQKIDFTDKEGEAMYIDINGTSMVVGSVNGALKLFDLSRRELRSLANPKFISESVPDFGELIQCRVNCKGTKVSCLVAQSSLLPDPKVYIWDVDTDAVSYFNFSSGREDEDDQRVPPNSATSTDSRELTVMERTKLESSRSVGGRFVVNHFWEPSDARLFVCEAKLLPDTTKPPLSSTLLLNKTSSAQVRLQSELLIVSMFSTSESGVVVQDWVPLGEQHSHVVGVAVPYFYLLLKLDSLILDADKISTHVMRDFQGLENADKPTKQAMMEFSYHLSVGNMDEAFKAIKTIKSQQVWENMARMCVKSKRLDVASVCLGNMGFARGARMLKIAQSEPELDARVAMLAVVLDMTEEAAHLYQRCGRWDLLNRLYQDTGEMEKAIELARTKDRIHLRHTFYRCAKTLEARGELQDAVPFYEQSETHRFEVPRMLFDDTLALEQYATQTKDKGVKRWWAQYMESTGDMDTALEYYQAAEDYLSLARVYCYLNDLDKAAKLANDTGDRAACYHLARQYENSDNIKEAIHFFTRAQAYGNAIRLCKENQFDDQMLNLALMAGPREQLDAARYFESLGKGGIERAVMLYHKAGLLTKATDLAFKHQQFNALQLIANDLTSECDPALLQKCAAFFIENGQFDKAVDMFAISKKYVEALDLCVEHNIPITDEVAERLTIPKGEGTDDERSRVLLKVAECAYAQNNYVLATKKYTEAGDKVNAMKSLMKSGDTKRIIYFAQTSRERDIYIMAANYLQSTDWQKSPEIMKSITTFYTKGKAYDLLAGFYDACAQAEIDEFHDYDKALSALTEAYKSFSKSQQGNTGELDNRGANLREKIELVKKFVTIRGHFQVNPDESMVAARDFANELRNDEAVRRGDLYAMIVEYLARQQKYEMAYKAIEQMRQRCPGAQVGHHISEPVLLAIQQAVGVQINRQSRGNLSGGGFDANIEISDDE